MSHGLAPAHLSKNDNRWTTDSRMRRVNFRRTFAWLRCPLAFTGFLSTLSTELHSYLFVEMSDSNCTIPGCPASTGQRSSFIFNFGNPSDSELHTTTMENRLQLTSLHAKVLLLFLINVNNCLTHWNVKQSPFFLMDKLFCWSFFLCAVYSL